MTETALFVRAGDLYTATALADGPWAQGALHGGAPAALLAHILAGEAAAGGLRLARLTCEFVRPTPRGPLIPRVETVRPGRRVTLLDATLHTDDGTITTRARALLLEASAVDAGPAGDPPPFPGPEQGEPQSFAFDRPMLAVDGVDMRFVEGRFRDVGPGTAWFALRYPVVAEEETLPLDRVAAAADFGNGIASELAWDEYVFINPDLTVHMERDPVDEWVAMQSRMHVHAGAVAMSDSVLWDRRGRIGRSAQSLLVAPRPSSAGSGAATTSGGTP